MRANNRDGREARKFEGHLLNWYDTTTLEPLLPRYVSTVDSGNLIASLVGTAPGMRRSNQSAGPSLYGRSWTPGYVGRPAGC